MQYFHMFTNGFAKKLSLMRKLKYKFEIPSKLFSGNADLRNPTQILCVKGAPTTQDICQFQTFSYSSIFTSYKKFAFCNRLFPQTTQIYLFL